MSKIGHTTQSLVVAIDDVEKHFAQAKRLGAEILKAPNVRSMATDGIARAIPKVTSGVSLRSSRPDERDAAREI